MRKTRQNLNKVGSKHRFVMRIKVCAYEGKSLATRSHNNGWKT